MHLGLFLVKQADQFVVLLDGLKRLNVDRLPAAARAVHHSRNTALPLRLYGNHEAFAADGDEIFLRRALAGKAPQRLPQAALDRPLLPLDLTADALQVGGGIIVEGAVRIQPRPQRA